MKFEIATLVSQNYQEVWEGFDERLFMALKPPIIPFKLIRFDGCAVGDEVHISIAGQAWHAKIIAQEKNVSEIYFVDMGIKLPFPLKKWKHKHRMLNNADGSCTIIDEIEYFTANKFLDRLLYPIFYQQFVARKPIYRRYFS